MKILSIHFVALVYGRNNFDRVLLGYIDENAFLSQFKGGETKSEIKSRLSVTVCEISGSKVAIFPC
jgi:hypothetical protein